MMKSHDNSVKIGAHCGFLPIESRRERTSRQVLKYWQLSSVSLALLLLMLSIIPLRLARAFEQVPSPQAILTLGGGTGREEVAAQLAQHNPDMEIWVSSGSLLPQEAYRLFQTFGIAKNRLHLDYRASDTVTNFTTLVADFEQRNIRHIYLVTSDFHMPRAMAIATIVLGSRGIAFTAIPVPCDRPKESTLKILRDSGRSLLWILTGQTGASLKEKIIL
jgi:uncharacterized SAM-binding protein YcdF (DUF218 family)